MEIFLGNKIFIAAYLATAFNISINILDYFITRHKKNKSEQKKLIIF